MKQLYRLVLCVGAALSACTHSEIQNDEQLPGGGGGAVSRVAFSAAVQPTYTLNYSSAAGSDVDLDQIQWPTAADFTLDLLSGSTTVDSYSYASMPAQLELPVGAYTLLARSGANAEAWNVPYFEGRQDFSLSASSTSFDAKLTCELKSTLVYVVFDEGFLNIFSDATAYLNTEHTKEAWTWTASERRVACMRPSAQMLIRVDVTMRSNGEKYNYGINPLTDLKAGELNVVRFTVAKGDVEATITADNGVTVREKTTTLEADWLATRSTQFVTSFDAAQTLENTFGYPYPTPSDVVLRSNVGLKSFKLKAAGNLAAALGGKTELSLFDPNDPNVSNNINELKLKTGLELTKQSGTMLYDGRINVRKALNTLGVLSGTSSDYAFELEAVDLLDQTVRQTFSVRIALPELQAQAIDPSKVWNRYAYLRGAKVVGAGITPEQAEKFMFEYQVSPVGVDQWRSVGKHTGTGEFYASGFAPNTSYRVRAVLSSGEYGPEATFATKPEVSLPNGHFADKTARSATNIGIYHEPNGWAHYNVMTMLNYNTTAYASRAYPSVTVEADGSVKIASRSWGTGNRIQHSLNASGGSDQWGNNTRQNLGAGKLFLGTCAYATVNTVNETEGWDYTEKPLGVRFRYKYLPLQGAATRMEAVLLSDGGVEMGRAEWTQDQVVLDFEEQTVPMAYTRSNFGLTPAKLRLSFVSQTTPPANNDLSMPPVGVDKTGGWNPGFLGFGAGPKWVDTKQSYFQGSVLYLDYVELVYKYEETDKYTLK